MPEYLPLPATGRTFAMSRRVRLGDTDPEGRVRPDAVARYLQDVATDDWDDSGADTGELWVLRRTAFRLVPGATLPTLGTRVEVVTWCSGIGAAWAERRTDVRLGGDVVLQAEALWVPLDAAGRPQRVRDGFRLVYDEAAAGRKVPGRVRPAEVPPDAARRPWPLRRVDLDVAGHVNNAASWTALVDVAGGPVASAALTHHGPLEWGDPVTLAVAPGRVWLLNGETVQVSGEFELLA